MQLEKQHLSIEAAGFLEMLSQLSAKPKDGHSDKQLTRDLMGRQ